MFLNLSKITQDIVPNNVLKILIRMFLLLKSEPVAWSYSEKKLFYLATLLNNDSGTVVFL